MTDTTANEVLYIRGMSASDRNLIKRAAQMRGMTLADYIGRIARLHDAIRARADNGGEDGQGDPALQAELEALGLQTVRG